MSREFCLNQSTLATILTALAVLTFTGCTERKSEGNTELPTSPSEDMSHLLVKPASAAGKIDFEAPRDYLPDPKIDWVITIEFEVTPNVSRERINGLLDASWLEEHGRPTVYGFSPHQKHWTFVSALDSPKSFTTLKIAWSLWDAIGNKPKEVSPDDLEEFRLAAEEKLAQLGKINTKIDRPSKDVLAVVVGLADIVAECDRDVTLILTAPEGKRFSGREVWDVMLCLGLDYGDGDLFHWINNSGFGDDHFFTVETSTPPGYFIPRQIASGEGDVRDLIFNFSIPRSADPVAVLDSMANAVKYAQDRLGGKVILGTGEPFERELERKKIQTVVKKLKGAGFLPGDSATCRVF